MGREEEATMKRTRMHLLAMPVVAIGLALAVSAWPTQSSALGVEGMGGKLGYSNPENLDGTTMLGVHAELEQRGSRVHVLPNVMYWNVDRVRDVNPNVDAYYHFEREGKVTPYLGAGVGLNIVHNDRVDRTNTDMGMNVMGGVRFPGSAHHVFVEGRYTASDVNQASILTGVTFHSR